MDRIAIAVVVLTLAHADTAERGASQVLAAVLIAPAMRNLRATAV
jgi:hypothetical protein